MCEARKMSIVDQAIFASRMGENEKNSFVEKMRLNGQKLLVKMSF
jgi:hypothetical protein